MFIYPSILSSIVIFSKLLLLREQDMLVIKISHPKKKYMLPTLIIIYIVSSI